VNAGRSPARVTRHRRGSIARHLTPSRTMDAPGPQCRTGLVTWVRRYSREPNRVIAGKAVDFVRRRHSGPLEVASRSSAHQCGKSASGTPTYIRSRVLNRRGRKGASWGTLLRELLSLVADPDGVGKHGQSRPLPPTSAFATPLSRSEMIHEADSLRGRHESTPPWPQGLPGELEHPERSGSTASRTHRRSRVEKSASSAVRRSTVLSTDSTASPAPATSGQSDIQGPQIQSRGRGQA